VAYFLDYPIYMCQMYQSERRWILKSFVVQIQPTLVSFVKQQGRIRFRHSVDGFTFVGVVIFCG